MATAPPPEGAAAASLPEPPASPRLADRKEIFWGLTKDEVIKEILNGFTIGFAQIPESVAFAFLANIKPPIALHAAWLVGIICSLFGGRPGMVNGATGAFAAIIATFIPEPEETGGNGEGIELLFPSVILAGLLMFVFAALKFPRFIILLPSPVMIGFCNGLAIVIGLAQLHPFRDSKTHAWKSGSELWWMLLITAVSMLIMEFFGKIPFKLFKIIPSSFLAIVSAIVLEFCVVRPSGGRTDTIADVSEFTSDTRLPIPFFIDHKSTDYDLSKITADGAAEKIIIQGVLLAVVGTIESLMTSEVVESFVKTPSDGQKTVIAMGVGNCLSGFLGGMGGNAMIGLSTINVLNGGKSRLAPCVVAAIVCAAIVGAYPALNYIPVAALAGIMLVVVLHTFKWFSLGIIMAAFMPESCRESCSGEKCSFRSKIPRVEAFVIVLVTVMCIILNIAYAVIVGVGVCGLMFAWNAGQIFKVQKSMEGNVRVYSVDGPLFFTSANTFIKQLDPDGDAKNPAIASVVVRFGFTAVMDYSAMEAMHKLASTYKNHPRGPKDIRFTSVNPESMKMIKKGKGLCASIEYQEEGIALGDAVKGVAAGFEANPNVNADGAGYRPAAGPAAAAAGAQHYALGGGQDHLQPRGSKDPSPGSGGSTRPSSLGSAGAGAKSPAALVGQRQRQ